MTDGEKIHSLICPPFCPPPPSSFHFLLTSSLINVTNITDVAYMTYI